MEKRGGIMTKNNRRKKHSISGKRYICACLLIVTMLLIATAAGCSRKPSEKEIEPTEGVTESLTPKPTETSELTKTPDTPGTVFTPSGISGRVTFTGNTVEVSEAGIGDTVQFGSYEQDHDTDNGEEAIEWLVLDKQDGKLLLLSKAGLKVKTYNDEYAEVTWETCTLRGWLNDTFYNTAFGTAEQERIVTAKVKTEDNPESGTEGGNDTEDKIFLLSAEEVLGYFNANDLARRAKVTAYAQAYGGTVWDLLDSEFADTIGNGWWWLRTPGNNGNGSVAVVTPNGVIDYNGYKVDFFGKVIRPAFWLNPEP